MTGEEIRLLTIGLLNLSFDNFIRLYDSQERAAIIYTPVAESRLAYLKGKYEDMQSKTLRWISELDFAHLDRLAEVLFCSLNVERPPCKIVREYGAPTDSFILGRTLVNKDNPQDGYNVTEIKAEETFDLFWFGNRMWQVMKYDTDEMLAVELTSMR